MAPTEISELSQAFKRSLLAKVIAQAVPSKDELNFLIASVCNNLLEESDAQCVVLYLVENDVVSIKYMHYAPSACAANPMLEISFHERRGQVMDKRATCGMVLVERVMRTGLGAIFEMEDEAQGLKDASRLVDFDVNTTMAVPIKGRRTIGAIQLFNKSPSAIRPKFTDGEVAYTSEVAEYAGVMLLRVQDTGFALNDEERARYTALYTDNPYVESRDDIRVDANLVAQIGVDTILETGIFPYAAIEDRSLAVLTSDPMNFQKRAAFTVKTHRLIDRVVVVSESFFKRICNDYLDDISVRLRPDLLARGQTMHAITEILGEKYTATESISPADELAELEMLEEEADKDPPVVSFVNKIIEDAYFSGASDIHIEPRADKVVVRYRVDGVCAEKLALSPKTLEPIVARVKIMGNLDIAQKRLPQDGRIDFSRFTRKKIDIDLRVATCPSLFGEKVVMRLLDKTRAALPITELGFSEENLALYRRYIRYTYGMILHCGPTGSGKSMTLFSALREIASPKINIQTIEDPVEYTLPGVNQLQTHKEIGLTFARALRAFLRLDPDVVLVGEIRDKETAETAIEAAFTGHLLLSTLHTNDAPSTVARFTEMGIDPFMLSSSLLLICSQRLVRRVCRQCRVLRMPNEEEARILERAIGWKGDIADVHEGGCPHCTGTGMRGRIGIHELMQNTPEVARIINKRSDTETLAQAAEIAGMKNLHKDSMLKVKNHDTTFAEAVALIPPDV